VIVPNVIGYDLSYAINAIEGAGLVPHGSGGGHVVTSQNPSDGVGVPGGSTVKFHLRDTGGQPP
jgi:PASTA domain